MKNPFASLSIAMVVLAALSLNATAQINVISVTNVLTIMVTNIVSVTNVTAKTYAITETDAVTVTNEIIQPPRYPWESSVSTGFTYASGNSETILFTATIQTHKKTPDNEIGLGADGSYGENNSVQNINNIHGSGQYNHLFSEKFFGYLLADALHDEIADLHYRITLSPGVGYYFLKETNTTLAGELGPAMVTERLGGSSDTYGTLRLAERFEHKFPAQNARIWQNIEFLPQVTDFNNYIANAEIGIEAAIYKKISLQAIVQDSFINQPASGHDQNDLKIVSGLKYKF